jgi:tetratricopeptide (TPR) repeat protein
LLLGEIGLAQKNAGAIREALNELTSWTHLVSPHFKKLEAAALALSGDDEGAIQAYQDFNTDVQRIDYGMSDHFYFFYERSLVDYNIAKIHEKMGNKENAVDFYEKFLAPMKAADPGIAEVENAKQRLAAIR